MHRTLPALVAVSLIAVAVQAQTPPAPANPPAPAATPTTPAPITDETLTAMREEMQTTRAEVLAKSLTLTSEQAAKFWPVLDAYQKEQNVIIDAQLKGLQRYVQRADSLSDEEALNLMRAHFKRDADMNALRQKWLAEFQKVLPTKLAVRAMQIDRRLSLSAQVFADTRTPLVH